MFPIEKPWDKQTLPLLFFSAIFLGGHGFTWFEAQKGCQAINETITTVTQSNKPYWTKYHKRRSNWIGTLGCSLDQDLSFKRTHIFTLNIPSAGLCQERCMERISNDSFLFVMQSKSCICLNEPLEKPSSPFSPCKYKYDCIEASSSWAESDCDGKSAYSFFFSRPQLEKKHFAMDDFKKELMSKFQKMCGILREPYKDKPACIVFARENYISFDREGIRLSGFEKRNILSCQRCKENGCSYVNCSDDRVVKVFCSKTTLPVHSTLNTTPETTTDIIENKSLKLNFTQISSTAVIIQQKTAKINGKTTIAADSTFPTTLIGGAPVKTNKLTTSNLNQTSIPKHKFSITLMDQQRTTKTNGNVTMQKNGFTTYNVSKADSTIDEKDSTDSSFVKEDEDGSLTVLIQIGASVLSLLISACIVCIVIRVIRRKRNVWENRSLVIHKDLSRGQIIEESSSNSQYAAIKNKTDEHSFEECTYDLADNSKLEEERSNTEGEESHYDHLRDKGSTKNGEEDIYNHLQMESESNYSTFTGGVEQQGLAENNYGHADFQNDSQTYVEGSVNIHFTDETCGYSKAQKKNGMNDS